MRCKVYKEEIIKNIFLGKLANDECIPASDEFVETKKRCDLLNEQMIEQLKDNSELLKKYNQTIFCFEDMSEQSDADHFVEGFKIGFLLAIELMN